MNIKHTQNKGVASASRGTHKHTRTSINRIPSLRQKCPLSLWPKYTKGHICTLPSSTKHTRNACTTTSRITCFYVYPDARLSPSWPRFCRVLLPCFPFVFHPCPPLSLHLLPIHLRLCLVFASPLVSIFFFPPFTPTHTPRLPINIETKTRTRWNKPYEREKKNVYSSSPETPTQSSPDFPESLCYHSERPTSTAKGNDAKFRKTRPFTTDV